MGKGKKLKKLQKRLGRKSWKPTKWFQLYTADGSLKAESSDFDEMVAFREEGDVIMRIFERKQSMRVEIDVNDLYTPNKIAKIKRDYLEN